VIFDWGGPAAGDAIWDWGAGAALLSSDSEDGPVCGTLAVAPVVNGTLSMENC
jgi:hypothetical protein